MLAGATTAQWWGEAHALAAGAQTQPKAILVIAHPDTPRSLANDELVRIFLGKTTHFSDGQPAHPVDQSESSETRDLFYMKLTGKNRSQMKTYWSRLIFTGKGFPPKTLPDDDAVIQWVSKNPGSIGYVRAGSSPKGVTVVTSLSAAETELNSGTSAQ